MGLEIRNASKNYGSKQVLYDISFQVADSSFISLLGPSGCGKTTLLSAIAGLTELDEGEIWLDGNLVSSASFSLPPEHRKIGMVFQDFALWPHMTAFQNVAFGLQMSGVKGKEIQQRVYETLRIFHMESYADRYPSELSGGQKQRIAMARAIAPRPKLILMDEPLSSLDAQLREEMRWELVRIFQQFKITTIYVTHDQTEAMSMADTIVLLKEGRIEQLDSPECMYQYPKTSFAARFLDTTNEITGEVLRTNHDQIEVQTPFGRLRSPRTFECSEGQIVTWMCRPHDLILADKTPIPADNVTVHNEITVNIRFRSFQGRAWRYVGTPVSIEKDQKTEQTLRFEFSSPLQYAVGDSVALQVPICACRVLPEASIDARSVLIEAGA